MVDWVKKTDVVIATVKRSRKTDTPIQYGDQTTILTPTYGGEHTFGAKRWIYRHRDRK